MCIQLSLVSIASVPADNCLSRGGSKNEGKSEQSLHEKDLNSTKKSNVYTRAANGFCFV